MWQQYGNYINQPNGQYINQQYGNYNQQDVQLAIKAKSKIMFHIMLQQTIFHQIKTIKNL